MFFIGATGPILTLILTVCLPFVFLVSGQQKLTLESPVNLLVIHQNQNEITFTESNVYDYQSDFVADIKNHQFEFEDFPTLQKFPFSDFQVRWKSVYSKSSGNKAPPVFSFLSC